MIKLSPMIKVSEHKHRGFTLIEVILTLVIAGIVAAGLAQYFGSAFTKSSVPIQRLGQALELQQVMENITADYRQQFTADLASFQTKIGNPVTAGYGPYTVVQNNFIEFAGTPPIESTPPALNNLLKVTISNGTGNTLTALFSLIP